MSGKYEYARVEHKIRLCDRFRHIPRSSTQFKREIMKLILLSLWPDDFHKMMTLCKAWNRMAIDIFPQYIVAAFNDNRRYTLMSICVKNNRARMLQLMVKSQEYSTCMRLMHILAWLSFVHTKPMPEFIHMKEAHWQRYTKEVEIFRNVSSQTAIKPYAMEMDIEIIEHYDLANNRGSDVIVRMLRNMPYPHNMHWIQRVYTILANRLRHDRNRYREVYCQLITAADMVIVPHTLVVPSFCNISEEDWNEYVYFRNPTDDDWHKWMHDIDLTRIQTAILDKIPANMHFYRSFISETTGKRQRVEML